MIARNSSGVWTMRTILAVGVCLAALAGPALAQSATSPALAALAVSGADPDPLSRFDARDMLVAVNEVRRAQGLGELRLNAALMDAAASYAADLARRSELSHSGEDGSAPPDRAAAAGYPGRYVAENLAAGYDETGALVADWMTSPAHRQTILLERAADLGVAIAIDPGSEYKTYWTLLVAAPTGG